LFAKSILDREDQLARCPAVNGYHGTFRRELAVARDRRARGADVFAKSILDREDQLTRCPAVNGYHAAVDGYRGVLVELASNEQTAASSHAA